jgi:hypothetical protein
MIDDKWVTITNKYKKTCVVCNRVMITGDLILWNKETSQSMHHPEMCNFLGIRKKMPSRKESNQRITNQKVLDEQRLAKRIEQYTFPVEVKQSV